MNYIRHYDILVTRAKNRILETHTETHHIIPKCLGGTDNKDNLVELTPEEHFVAHQLLVKIYPNTTGLAFACLKMVGNPWGLRGNKAYGWLRRRHANETSKRMIGNNHALGTVRTAEDRAAKSVALKEYYKNNKRSEEHKRKNKESFKNSLWNTVIRKERAEKLRKEKADAKMVALTLKQ